MPVLSYLFYFLLSFLLMVFAQPDWSTPLCVLSASLGLFLFWKGVRQVKSQKRKFWSALAWFGTIQFIQLSWLLSDKYVGWPIFLFVLFLGLGLGAQFGLLTVLVLRRKPLTYFTILAGAGFWVVMEASRLKFLSGYTWNPLGLILSAHPLSMQCASFFGVFGLSFWIVFVNLLALKWLDERMQLSRLFTWGFFALLPYIIGFGMVKFHEKKMGQESNSLSALLIQTAILPEEKYPYFSGDDPVFAPIVHLRKVLSQLASHKDKKVDLILLSESALPYGPSFPIYYPEDVKEAFHNLLGDVSEGIFPKEKNEGKGVGNTYFAKALAHYFNADVIIGLDDLDKEGKAYNAAFLFSPDSNLTPRYEKRILLPIAEYIPFNWCKKLAKRYGIEDSFTPGEEAKVFLTKKAKVGFSICYEETHGTMMRENYRLGANLLVNLSNDVWYPRSRLPLVHYYHSRLRTVEGGLPLLRSCNTGLTCAIDSLGRTLSFLPSESRKADAEPGVLYAEIPLYNYKTFYALVGDYPLFIFSFGITTLFLIFICLPIPQNYQQRNDSILL